MGRVSRDEFIEFNYGPVHRLDIRATIGKMTMATPEDGSPSVRATELRQELGNLGLKVQAAYYHIGREIEQMDRMGMVKAVEGRAGPGGGARYMRTESELLAQVGWQRVRAAALEVVEFYPDDPRNEVWRDFVMPPEAPEASELLE